MGKRNSKRYLFTSDKARECQLISTEARRKRKEEYLHKQTQPDEPIRYNLRERAPVQSIDSDSDSSSIKPIQQITLPPTRRTQRITRRTNNNKDKNNNNNNNNNHGEKNISSQQQLDDIAIYNYHNNNMYMVDHNGYPYMQQQQQQQQYYPQQQEFYHVHEHNTLQDIEESEEEGNFNAEYSNINMYQPYYPQQHMQQQQQQQQPMQLSHTDITMNNEFNPQQQQIDQHQLNQHEQQQQPTTFLFERQRVEQYQPIFSLDHYNNSNNNITTTSTNNNDIILQEQPLFGLRPSSATYSTDGSRQSSAAPSPSSSFSKLSHNSFQSLVRRRNKEHSTTSQNSPSYDGDNDVDNKRNIDDDDNNNDDIMNGINLPSLSLNTTTPALFTHDVNNNNNLPQFGFQQQTNDTSIYTPAPAPNIHNNINTTTPLEASFLFNTHIPQNINSLQSPNPLYTQQQQQQLAAASSSSSELSLTINPSSSQQQSKQHVDFFLHTLMSPIPALDDNTILPLQSQLNKSSQNYLHFSQKPSPSSTFSNLQSSSTTTSLSSASPSSTTLVGDITTTTGQHVVDFFTTQQCPQPLISTTTHKSPLQSSSVTNNTTLFHNVVIPNTTSPTSLSASTSSNSAKAV